MVCVIVPLLVIVGLFWRTVVVEDDVNKLSKNPDVLVQVTAFKWNWQFTYEQVKNASGKETTTAYTGQNDLINGAEERAAVPVHGRVRQRDPGAGAADSARACRSSSTRRTSSTRSGCRSSCSSATSSRTARPQQQSKSGLHDNRFEFTATSTGSFVGRCAELCGTYHSQMNFEVRVVSPDVFAQLPGGAEEDRPGRPGPPGEGAGRGQGARRRVRHDDAPVRHQPHRRRGDRRELTMKIEARIFLLLTLFCWVAAAIYAFWSGNTGDHRTEWAGFVGAPPVRRPARHHRLVLLVRLAAHRSASGGPQRRRDRGGRRRAGLLQPRQLLAGRHRRRCHPHRSRPGVRPGVAGDHRRDRDHRAVGGLLFEYYIGGRSPPRYALDGLATARDTPVARHRSARCRPSPDRRRWSRHAAARWPRR